MANVIGFPGLGLEFTVNRVAFSVLGRPIYFYALIILCGFVGGLAFVLHDIKKTDIKSDAIWDIALYGLIAGLLGARLYYCIFDGSVIDGNWLNFFKLWEGGIAIYGAIIGAVVSTAIYCRVKKYKILNMFDICVTGLIIGQAVGRWGNFVNAEVYGGPTELPWRMTINGSEGVHPLFLYESLWNFLGLAAILLFRGRKKADGEVFFFYVMWYGIGRFLLEGMRVKEYILCLPSTDIPVSQVVALACVAIGLTAIIVLRNKNDGIV